MLIKAWNSSITARREDGGGTCKACGGMRKSWPKELTIIEGGIAMAKTVKEQIAEALAPIQKDLEEARDINIDVWRELEGTDEGTVTALAKKRWKELCDAKVRIYELELELESARAAVEERVANTQIGCLDTGAGIYRDALADFAIRVLSGGVAVNFREARP